jgi:Fe-Mn family superoxide dismutase
MKEKGRSDSVDPTRRAILKTGLYLLPALWTAGFSSELVQATEKSIKDKGDTAMPFELPKLPYSYDALEPYIDAKTMEIHYTKHHQAYLDRLNAALKDYPDLQSKTIDELLSNLGAIPEAIRTTVRNHGGGYANHNLFWVIMAPKAGGEPKGEIAEAIKESFGSFQNFKDVFSKAALDRFGSGWAWLVLGKTGKLEVTSTPNQDTPISDGLRPLMGLDVWEHAYYLKYQNRRADYIAAWWNVVNWEQVGKNYAEARR